VTDRLSVGLTANVPLTTAPSPPTQVPPQNDSSLPPVPPTAVIVTLVTPAGTATEYEPEVEDENSVTAGLADAVPAISALIPNTTPATAAIITK